MPQWGANASTVAGAPKYRVLPNFKANTINTGNLYMNTYPSKVVNGQVIGLYGVSAASAAATQQAHNVQGVKPGWVLVKQGMGPVTTITASPGGTGYSNTDLLSLAANGCSNVANISISTNTTGGILTIGNSTVSGIGGGLFPNNAFITKSFANATGGASLGSAATITVGLGGRAGRIQRETLIVIPSMGQNTSTNSALYPLT